MQASRIIENGNKLVQIVELGNIRALYLAIGYMDEVLYSHVNASVG